MIKLALRLIPCLTVLLLWAVAAQAAPSSIRVVMDDNYPPFIFKADDGRPHGILVDQWRLWEQKTGVKAELHPMPWAEAQRRMRAGEFDVIDTIFKTDERLKYYDFTPPYQTIDVPVYYAAELSGIRDASSLKGFTVAVKEGDAVIEFLHRHDITALATYPSYEAIIRAAAEHKVSVFSADQPAASYFLNKFGIVSQFRKTAPLYTGQLHRAVAKGNQELLTLVNQGFRQIPPEELEKIEQDWLGVPEEKRLAMKYLIIGLSAALIILMLLLASNWWLRGMVNRKTAQLQLSEAQYRELVQSANSVILRWKRDGTITFINDYGLRFFGFSSNELLGKPVQGTIVPKQQADGKNLLLMLHDIFENPDDFQQNTNQNITKDGRLVWVSWTNHPISDQQGTVSEMLSVGTDITELKEVESKLLLARQAAETANETKSLFLANMSHEIRTPLNAIVGINSLLAEQLPPGELKELSRDAVAAANNLLEIISDVLDLSRIEAGKLTIKPVPFEPRMLMRHLERMFTAMIRDKGLQFEVSLSHDLPDCLVADPARIQQIATNLLSNAVKFTEHGTIRLRLAGAPSADGRIALSLIVSDTGKGIMPQNLERIFSPFEQEDLTTTRKYGGTGLGLAISRLLAEMMGGNVTVQSTPGEGSTFTCTIPCERYGRMTAGADEVTVETAAGPIRRLKILVAEDSVVNSKMLEAILRMDGHRIRFAVNGQQAVEVWREEAFDLILMDIQMPVMDGMQATAAIRSAEAGSDRRIPIIALTAYAMNGDRERFLAAGMDDYLPKPVTVDQIRAMLAKAINTQLS
ncbi:ATP-binding protein [Trichlorobacter ammonificans]|uniref:histidine kinase n=1 Tax=Trichlorobacter ammonificans TaxID=2916410 RepID=A0ABM9D7H1_9BACT|nr:transporter substrate-binding domain-containing protein [Trichlorobacter ammonificans]CAH2030435.1 Histidine kinase [Trichlorobacter ammonificans]